MRATGIEPVILTPGDAVPRDWSGLLLMGGPDVNPARYGEARHETADEPDDARDDLECALIADALSRDLPVLGICRGVQILNVQHGGTLVQHLHTTDRHRQRDPENLGAPAHQVEIISGTRLASIEEGARTLAVNSRHHQAIALLGEGLRISARDSEDGVIEAVERPDKRFVIGVQWHPENMAGVDAPQAKLFEAFARALHMT